MKTKIHHRRGQIQLKIEEGESKGSVIAQLQLYEGTGCWTLQDIRLSKFQTPNPYGDVSAQNISATYIFKDTKNPEKEIKLLESQLHSIRFYDDKKGNKFANWNPMDGVVKGHPTIKGYAPTFNGVIGQGGYFSRAEGLEKLKEIQTYWDTQPEWSENCRMKNPHSQPSESDISFMMMEAGIRHKPEPDNGFRKPSPPPPSGPK